MSQSAEGGGESSKSKVKKKEVNIDTALHIIKGAIVKVIRTPLTQTVECQSKTKGRISVEYEPETPPTDDQVREIEQLCNQIIRDNVEIKSFKMERKQAEEHYKNNLVNNTYIYDKYPVPDSVTELTLVEIPNWNVNCCPSPHFSKTGEVGALKIVKVNHRPKKKELEFAFELFDPSEKAQTNTSSGGSSSSKKPEAQKPPAQKIDTDNIQLITDKIIDLFIKENLTEKSEEDLKKKLHPQIETLLNTLRNSSYSKGFTAKLEK
eukprot:TRINITY_DN3765_c0_g1_i1.p1 TRINITY_DN3765_c0_g1~~TRINITY_DN3765_c0_g1_i1.p1  ORF type:complete len:264 (+),score=60.94 TRINITY_DN3765_c0_g1_i1:144-935(+)